MLDLALEDIVHAGQLLLFGRTQALQNLYRVSNRRDGIAQLMGEHGQEFIFAAVGGFNRKLGLSALADAAKHQHHAA